MAARCLRSFRHYSTQPPSTAEVSAIARRKWGLAGIPTPQSILNTDDPLPPSLSLSEPDESDLNSNYPRKPPTEPTPSQWRAHRLALKKTFPSGWSPPRKLSREAMDGLRQMHKFDPEKFATPVLAERFRISPEAVRRILRSKWVPSEEKKSKWAEKGKKVKEERLTAKRLALQKERQEAQEIFLAKEFSGGLSLKR